MPQLKNMDKGLDAEFMQFMAERQGDHLLRFCNHVDVIEKDRYHPSTIEKGFLIYLA